MKNIWSSSSGRIELDISIAQASQGYHSGRCDLDIAELRQDSFISKQLKALNPELVASELQEYGAWDAVELSNHEENLERLLWLACGDLVEEAAA